MNDVSSKSSNSLTLSVGQVDEQLAHLWMVRTFIKHSDESQDDEDLREVARELYDFILALCQNGPQEIPQGEEGRGVI
jgi:cob(I)alamin adenosyltransferase